MVTMLDKTKPLKLKLLEPEGPMNPRECGGCTACCKLLGVTDLDPPKPAWTWCKHCTVGQGCQIYDSRPQSCKNFACMYQLGTPPLEGMRPDQCKVMYVAGYTKADEDKMRAMTGSTFKFLVAAYELVPGAHKNSNNRKFIQYLLMNELAVAILPDNRSQRKLLVPEGHQLNIALEVDDKISKEPV
jgi:hypothetical protein